MFRLASVASVLTLIATPAVAQTTSAAAPAAQQVASTDSSDARRIVCKKEESIGSRLGSKKVCLTVKEWEDLSKDSRDATEGWQRQTPTRPSG